MSAHVIRGDLFGQMFVPHFWFERIMYEETGGLIRINVKSELYAWGENLYAVGDGRIPIAQVAVNYNYNDNTTLVNAIRGGYRGAYWDIMRRMAEGIAVGGECGNEDKGSHRG